MLLDLGPKLDYLKLFFHFGSPGLHISRLTLLLKRNYPPFKNLTSHGLVLPWNPHGPFCLLWLWLQWKTDSCLMLCFSSQTKRYQEVPDQEVNFCRQGNGFYCSPKVCPWTPLKLRLQGRKEQWVWIPLSVQWWRISRIWERRIHWNSWINQLEQ